LQVQIRDKALESLKLKWSKSQTSCWLFFIYIAHNRFKGFHLEYCSLLTTFQKK
jgi:hypothetical protein